MSDKNQMPNQNPSNPGQQRPDQINPGQPGQRPDQAKPGQRDQDRPGQQQPPSTPNK